MYDYIDTQEQLEQFIDDISSYDWIAIDTEFIREKTYYSRLCLLQIATTDHLACVDPLAISDISALKKVLYNPNITKVWHAAHQDQEIFYNLFGEPPAPIFDTQPAAAVLGIGDQIGYARLIEEFMSVSLEKTQSRTDWSRRPLSEKQLDYAIDDVRYLREAYPKIVQQLEDQSRLEWLQSDFDRYTSVETFEPKPAEMWKKVKGHQRLKPLQLTIVQGLASWREGLAEKKDLPRKWIMSDDVILDLALQQPANADEMDQMRTVKSKQHSRYFKDWLACINTAQQLDESEWLRLPKFKKPSSNQAILVDLLMVAIREQANIHNISATLITSRKKLEKLVMSGETQLANDWRGALVNPIINNILSGQATFSVENGNKVRIGS